MRNLIYILFLSFSLFSLGQIKYGIKAGLNYDVTTSIKQVNLNLDGSVRTDDTEFDLNINNAAGFYAGAFLHIGIKLIYIRPEIQFSQTSRSFLYRNNANAEADLKFSKIDFPILFGYQPIPLLSFVLGPVLNFNSSDEINFGPEGIGGFILKELSEQTTYGLQIGARLKVKKFGFDIRYETTLSNNTADVSATVTNGIPMPDGRIDFRSSFLNIGLSFDFN